MIATVSDHDRALLRELATRYMELCASDENQARVSRWRNLNNMKAESPVVLCNCSLLAGEIGEYLAAQPDDHVEDEGLRDIDCWLRRELWHATLGDDRVFRPWYAVRAKMFTHPEGVWGVEVNRVRDEVSRGWRNMPVLKTMADLDLLKATEHRVLDPHPPQARKLEDIFGDILPIHIRRSTIYPYWSGTDLSEAPGALFGLEELLMALYTEPEMVHRFMAFTRDAVVANLKQGEAAGDWSTADSFYYVSPPDCDDLPAPAANSHGAPLADLAYFSHAQEFEGVSPEMHEEFLLNYQMPVMELFGRIAYGCCETLDNKLDIINRIPNLTKVLSGPRSDPAHYPEKVGERCVISWRPVATCIASEHFNEHVQRRQMREGFAKLKGCQVTVHLHEPMSVQHDMDRLFSWVRIAREEAERAFE